MNIFKSAAAYEGWLRNHLDAPTKGLPEADDELDQLVRQLETNARRSTSKMPALEAQRIRLEIELNRRRRSSAQTREDRHSLDRELIDLKSRLDDWIDRSLG